MLIKSELAKIALLACPTPPKDYVYVAATSVTELPRCGKILVIDVYDGTAHTLVFRFVCDGTNVLLCEEWPASQWIVKQPRNILDLYHIWASPESEALAKEFLGEGLWHGGVLGAMERFISNIYWQKSKKAHDRKYAKMQEHFAMFPAFPDDLAEYCDRHVFPHTYIFVSKVTKGKRDAVCGHCQKKIKVDTSTRPGTFGTCPKCGMTARYRGSWAKNNVLDKAKICITGQHEGQLLLRWAYAERVYHVGSSKPAYHFDDYFYNLYLVEPKGATIYSYAYQSAMGLGWDWYRKKNGEVNYRTTHLYTENLAEVFGESYYNVNLQEGLHGIGEINFPSLLDNLRNVPAAEYLFKLGLTRLAASSSADERTGTSFAEVLGISKQYLPLCCKLNVSRFEVEAIRASRTWVTEEMLLKFRALRLEEYQNEVVDLLDTMSFERFVGYFTRQRAIGKRMRAGQLLTWYRDYISMSQTLRIDLSHKAVRFPKDIKAAHDRIVARFNEVKYTIEDANFAQATEALYSGLTEYEKGEYRIVFPSSRGEFITEGQALNHCIGGNAYFENHLQGRRMIFFVRKIAAPEKPFFTMEIDMRALKIVQLYGFGNSSAPTQVRQFANEFLRRLTPAERMSAHG